MRISTLFAAAAFGLMTIGGAQAAGVTQGAAALPATVADEATDLVQDAGWRRHRHYHHRRHWRRHHHHRRHHRHHRRHRW